MKVMERLILNSKMSFILLREKFLTEDTKVVVQKVTQKTTPVQNELKIQRKGYFMF